MTIEEHLAALGVDPGRFTDSDRLEIARAVADCYWLGCGYMRRDYGGPCARNGKVQRVPALSATVVLPS